VERGVTASRELLVCSALILATLGVYAQTIGFDFLDYDDVGYVAENQMVREGLTAQGVAWSFTTLQKVNWQPLTWISHMLDCQLYGLNPAGHHATSVLLHLLNSILLFGCLRFMTRAVWPSAFVAALFALHPLQVESVAWVSERKNLLSTLFGLLSIWAYAAYARRGGAVRYALVALLLALGLMAKPMLVTFPLLFLLLDYWPLRRVGWGEPGDAGEAGSAAGATGVGLGCPRQSTGRLLVEKIPLLALSAASSAATFLIQRGGGAVVDAASHGRLLFAERAANAVTSYLKYMEKALWPSDLALHYPHPYLAGGTPWSGWQVAGAVAILLLISACALAATRRRYALVGWLWYLGTLVPVIGLVQVGRQAMADRYAYVPLIGLFIVVAWGGFDWMNRARRSRPWLPTAVAMLAVWVLTAAAAAAWAQTRYWRNPLTLYSRAVAATSGNALMHNNLAGALRSIDRFDLAMRHYLRALEIDPRLPLANQNLVDMLVAMGEAEEAAQQYRRWSRADPESALPHFGLGTLLASQRDFEQAIREYRRALEIQPDSARVNRALGMALAERGEIDQAIHHYRRALEKDPESAPAHFGLAQAMRSRGQLAEAIHHYRRAAELQPDSPVGHHGLGQALLATGDVDGAVDHLRRALEIEPDAPQLRSELDEAMRAQEEARGGP
jgi:tetratricopeptide (TPR) repeat protein